MEFLYMKKEELNNEQTKSLRKRILITSIICMLLLLASVIMMFFDYTKVYEYNSFWKEYDYEFYDTPISGVMPSVGLFLIFIGFCLIVKIDVDRRKRSITTAVFYSIGTILMYTNANLLSFVGEVALGGFIMSVIASVILGCSCIPMSFMLFVEYSKLLDESNKKKMNISYASPQTIQKLVVQKPVSTPKEKGISESDIKKLKELKDLLNSGILTEEEFLDQKKKILK